MTFNKKNIIIAALVAIVCSGCFTNQNDETKKVEVKKPIVVEGNILVDKKDVVGDDNGPGTYCYPSDTIFARDGFDLRSVKLTETDTHYNFYIEIGRDFKNDWKMEGGWDIQLFDIYLNLGTGKNKQTISGRHVFINDGWDKAIIISPSPKSEVLGDIMGKNSSIKDDITTAESISSSILTPDTVEVSGNILVAKILKDKIREMGNLKKLQVFLLGSEGEPTNSDTVNRVVNEYQAQWRFGGGTDYEGDPNVIDILGDNTKLGSYKSDKNTIVYAKIDMISK